MWAWRSLAFLYPRILSGLTWPSWRSSARPSWCFSFSRGGFGFPAEPRSLRIRQCCRSWNNAESRGGSRRWISAAHNFKWLSASALTDPVVAAPGSLCHRASAACLYVLKTAVVVRRFLYRSSKHHLTEPGLFHEDGSPRPVLHILDDVDAVHFVHIQYRNRADGFLIRLYLRGDLGLHRKARRQRSLSIAFGRGIHLQRAESCVAIYCA